VRAYLAFLHDRGATSRTIARRIASLRRYFGWAMRQRQCTLQRQKVASLGHWMSKR
jgi:site-specific recombinase XerD